MKKIILALMLLPLINVANADYKDTDNVKVKLISMWADGGLLVQTEPQPNITGLNCSSSYWLKLSNTYEGYDSMLSIVLAAHLANKEILVRAVDDAGTDFCRLERVILGD